MYVRCVLDFSQFWKVGKAFKIRLKWSGVLPWIEVNFIYHVANTGVSQYSSRATCSVESD